jgi:DNA polymerase-1
MTEQSRPLLVLVDGHAVAYRAFYSIPQDRFQTKAGEPTNATYGFTRVILDILDESPDYFAISFDLGLSGRDEVYEEYKGTREKMPDELSLQLGRIDQVVRAFNIPVLAIEGYEADDVIGTITQQAEAQGCQVRIVTGDQDLLQLLSEHTLVQLPQRGKPDKVYGLEDYEEKYPTLAPAQLPDMKGLMGDPSDNIPGVKGIGQKTALKLLQAYQSIEAVYEHINEISGANHRKLEEGRELAFLSKKLATIQRDIPITLNLQECVTHDYDPETVNQLFRELEFRSLGRRLRSIQDTVLQQANMFAAEEVEESTQDDMEPVEFTTVDDKAKLAALVKELNQADIISFDTETTGIDAMSANLVGISVATRATHGYYIPLGHIAPNAPEGVTEGISLGPEKPTQSHQAALLEEQTPRQLPTQQVLDALRPAMTNPDIPKIAHNAKYDLQILRRYGIEVGPIAGDTMLAEWLTDPGSNNLNLKDLAWVRRNIPMQKITDLIGTGSKQITMARVPIDKAAPYAAADAAVPLALDPELKKELQQGKLRQLYDELEIPLIPVVADMEMHGVLLDLDYLDILSKEMDERIRKLEEEVYLTSSYGEFNINSLHQLNDVLFGKLQLSTEGLRKTKSGRFSLTAEVLESKRGEHAVIPMILEYRSLNKLKSTYIDALPALVNPYTGRIHTSYHQAGTTTGRFSSSDPNLQNIPIRTDEGRRIRKAFIAPEGHVLLSTDYSQVELRILAHYSGDEALLEAFRKEQDIHASTAAAVYHIKLQDVTFEQRSFAKSVNFGLMYGMGPYRLSRESNLTLGEAEDFIETYFERFPGVKAYLDSSKAFAEEHGYVETLMGRRRHFPQLKRDTADRTGAMLRRRAEREAINMPIQGTAADILKLAMLNLHHELLSQNFHARMNLQVHDELVLEVPEDELPQVARLVIDTMEKAFELKTPLKAEAKVGKNWHDMSSYEG